MEEISVQQLTVGQRLVYRRVQDEGRKDVMDLKPEATVHDTGAELENITQFVSKALMTMWFAGRKPADEARWLEIARMDAAGVVNSLAEAGYLNLTGERQ